MESPQSVHHENHLMANKLHKAIISSMLRTRVESAEGAKPPPHRYASDALVTDVIALMVPLGLLLAQEATYEDLSPHFLLAGRAFSFLFDRQRGEHHQQFFHDVIVAGASEPEPTLFSDFVTPVSPGVAFRAQCSVTFASKIAAADYTLGILKTIHHGLNSGQFCVTTGESNINMRALAEKLAPGVPLPPDWTRTTDPLPWRILFRSEKQLKDGSGSIRTWISMELVELRYWLSLFVGLYVASAKAKLGTAAGVHCVLAYSGDWN